MMLIIGILSVICVNCVTTASFDIGNLANSVRKAAVSANMLNVNFITDIQAQDIVDSFSEILSKELALNLEILSDLNVLNLKRTSSIILMRNSSSFNILENSKFSKENFDADGKILIAVATSADNMEKNFTKIFDVFWQNHIGNINFVVVKNEKIKMLTFLPFNSSHNCRNVEPRVINNFENNTWEIEQIFPDKFHNLNKCPIKVLSFIFPPYLYVNENGENSGYEFEFISLITQLINASLIVELSLEPAAWGFLYENGTAGGALKNVLEGHDADVTIGNYYLTAARAKYLSFCIYTTEKIVITIPPGIPFNTFEKLVSPYALNTWLVLIITLAIALLVIIFTKRQRETIRNFIFGRNTGNPFLNFLEIILSGSQVKSPKTNFARTLMMYFVLFCIVMRTLYQSGLFKFLQTDQRHPQVQTIDEIVEQKFDVYMYESFTELSQGLKIHKRRKYVGNYTMSHFMLKTLNPYNRISAVGPLTDVLYDNQKNFKNYKYKILPEILFSIPVAMYFPKNHYIVNEMASRFKDIESAGLKNYYISKYFSVVREDKSTPLVKLNIDQLSGGLILYIIGCIMGSIALLFEMSIKYLMDLI